MTTTLSAPADARLEDLALAGVTLVAWAAFGWATLVLALGWGSSAAGAVGRGSAAALRHVAPVAARRGLALALGAGLATASGWSAAPAGAAVGIAATARGSAGVPAGWTPDRPVAERPPQSEHRPASSRKPTGGVVVVRAGDTLWSIAAGALGSAASAEETARAWPQWWTANRAEIGPDPGSLRPGQVLVAPVQPPRDRGGPVRGTS